MTAFNKKEFRIKSREEKQNKFASFLLDKLFLLFKLKHLFNDFLICFAQFSTQVLDEI